MRLTKYLFTVILYVSVINSTILDKVKENVIYLLKPREENTSQNQDLRNDFESHKHKSKGYKINEGFVKQTPSLFQLRMMEDDFKDDDSNSQDIRRGQSRSRILNNYRRKQASYPGVPNIIKPAILHMNDTESSSVDMEDWQAEWNKLWLEKKMAAVNKTPTNPSNDINMINAAPRGKECGDPNQHDLPWGTCVLAIECDSEDRIYRGDSFCGRTEYVCCGILISTYDYMFANDEMSMETSGLQRDPESMEREAERDRHAKFHKAIRDKRKRALSRYYRKRTIRKKIIRIIREITKLLVKMYTNTTKKAQKKTKTLKKYIKMMKKKFKNDRQAVQDIFNSQMVDIDRALLTKLIFIQKNNKYFWTNDTFREIITNGTISQRGARMLVEGYPELYNYIPKIFRNRDILPPSIRQRRKPSRRSAGLKYNIGHGIIHH